MRTIEHILLHLIGIPVLVGITAYTAIPEHERKKVNNTVKDLTKGNCTLKEICEDVTNK